MLLKYLILGLIVYGVFKFFIQPTLKPPVEPPQDPLNIRKDDKPKEGDYIDYEEIE